MWGIIIAIWAVAVLIVGIVFFITRTVKKAEKNEDAEEQRFTDTKKAPPKPQKVASKSNAAQSNDGFSLLSARYRDCSWVYRLVVILSYIIAGLSVTSAIIIGISAIFNGIELLLVSLTVLVAGLLAVLSLIAYFIISAHFYYAARDKGYESLFYLTVAFFVPACGYPLIIALPDRGDK